MSKAKHQLLTVREFSDLLDNARAARFVGLRTVTTPKLTVKDRETKAPWADVFPGVDPENVRKLSSGCATIGPEYVTLVVNRLAGEGKAADEYKPGVTWHEAVAWSKCIRVHKKTGEPYAWFAFLSKVQRGGKWVPLKMRVRYVDIATGIEIDRDKLAGFLPKEHEPTNQGLDADNQVIVRTYKLESIKQVTMGSTVYTVVTK